MSSAITLVQTAYNSVRVPFSARLAVIAGLYSTGSMNNIAKVCTAVKPAASY